MSVGMRSWLARLPDETPSEQMERIRQTCRWCGEFFDRGPHGVGTAMLRRHEFEHVNRGDE